jgi:hypothetical protein
MIVGTEAVDRLVIVRKQRRRVSFNHWYKFRLLPECAGKELRHKRFPPTAAPLGTPIYSVPPCADKSA